MSTQAQPEGSAAPDEQLQRELQLLVQRHAEYSRRLESLLAEMEGIRPIAPDLPAPAPLPAPQSENTVRELSRLNDRVSYIEEHLETVNRQIGVNSGRIQEILESRTWKAFTGMGGILLRLLGRR